MLLQSSKQTTAIHILSNISRHKYILPMKCGQLTECNMGNIFLKKCSSNVMGKLVREPFLKNLNWGYLWIKNLKFFYRFTFIVCSSWGFSEYIKTNMQTICFYLQQSFYKNQKDVWNSSSCSVPAQFLLSDFF